MTDFWPLAVQLGRLCAAAAVGFLLFRGVRWIGQQSRLLGAIVATGILLRALVGLALFWVSYLKLPVLGSLQMGEGFWTVTPDARAYYRYAVAGVESGLLGMYPGDSSPFFVRTFAVWMNLVGVSPAAGMFLNLSAHVTLCALLVRICRPQNDWRKDSLCIASVASFSFSPVSLVHGTQALKEDLFALLIALACLGMLWLFRALIYREPAGRARVAFLGSLLLLSAVNYGIAGIRPYYAVIVWLTLACVMGLFAFFRRTTSRMIAYAPACVLVLAVVWSAYWQGVGPYYWGPTWSSVPAPANAFSALQQVRIGFQLTGGDTSMAPLEQAAIDVPASDAPAEHAAKDLPASDLLAQQATKDILASDAPAGVPANAPMSSLPRPMNALLIGMGAVFVPIHVLQALSIVRFPGGRGLLPVADLDTLFLDVSLLAMFVLLYRERTAIGSNLPFVAAMMCLSLLTAGLLGYVVTNFGTLFRIKSMVGIPVWLLCLAVNRDEFRPIPDRAPRHG